MRYVILSILLLLTHMGTAENAAGQNRGSATVRHQDTDSAGTGAARKPYARFTDSNRNGAKNTTGKQARSPRRNTGKNNSGGLEKVDRFSDRDGDGINDDRATDSRNNRLKQIEEQHKRRNKSSRE